MAASLEETLISVWKQASVEEPRSLRWTTACNASLSAEKFWTQNGSNPRKQMIRLNCAAQACTSTLSQAIVHPSQN